MMMIYINNDSDSNQGDVDPVVENLFYEAEDKIHQNPI